MCFPTYLFPTALEIWAVCCQFIHSVYILRKKNGGGGVEVETGYSPITMTEDILGMCHSKYLWNKKQKKKKTFIVGNCWKKQIYVKYLNQTGDFAIYIFQSVGKKKKMPPPLKKKIQIII